MLRWMVLCRLTVAFGLAVLLAGCLPISPTPTPPPAGAATPTVAGGEPSPTESPTPPSTVPQPTIILPEAERLEFDPGATEALAEGELAPREARSYVLAAREGDLLDILVSAPEQGVRLVIYGVDGQVLRSGMADGMGFRGIVPSTQDYIITLDAGDAAVSYTLNVSIPQRIQFAPGGTSATLEGTLAPHQRHAYVAGVNEGQVLDVQVTAPDPGVQLVIYGVDGTVLRSGMGEGSTFSGPVPSTQDYIVAVSAGEEGVQYTMTLSVPQ